MYINKAEQVTKVIKNYFDGIYYGDTEKLRNSFGDDVHLYGDVKGDEYLKSLDEYLEGVKNRKSPSELKEKNQMEILSIEIMGNIAMAKLHVPMLGFNYYDFLSLCLIQGEWIIVNKLFTHVE